MYIKWPQIKAANKSKLHREVSKRDALSKESMKVYSDNRKRVEEPKFRVGEKVHVEHSKHNTRFF